MLADHDARSGDFGGAVDVLEGAEAPQGKLPPNMSPNADNGARRRPDS